MTRARLAAQHGFTTIVLLAALLIGSLLVAAAFTAAQGDTGPARRDQFYKQAYSAAEAGVSYYLAHLTQDTNYWTKCYDQLATPTSPANTATQIWPQGTAFNTATSRQVPNSTARYQIELLLPPPPAPPAVAPTTCNAANSASVIDPTTGQLSIRSTGFYRGVKRSIIATFKQPGFLQYLWYTYYETPDPTAQGTSYTSCAKYARENRDASTCGDQSFANGDAINGPLHTNDVLRICGSPSFGRAGKTDSIEVSDPRGAIQSTSNGCSMNATWNGTKNWGALPLPLPTSNGSLANYASVNGAGATCAASNAACWLFTGPVHITLQTNGVDNATASGVRVVSSTGTVLKSGNATYPPNGVLYVKNTSGSSCNFDTNQDYPANNGCGDAWVRGTANKDITIGADNDVIIDGDVKHTATSVIGLIANGFVRVYHPCQATTDRFGRTTYSNGTTSPEDPNVGSLTNPTVQAAILALTHSWMVDNNDCGTPLGTLTVTGALAQKFRGTVSRISGGTVTSGYVKSYTYDPVLKYHQPPYFLPPAQAVWDLYSQTDQVPAH